MVCEENRAGTLAPTSGAMQPFWERTENGGQRRPFTEEMGSQLGLDGQVRRRRWCTRVKREGAEVRVSKVGLAKEKKRRYYGQSRDSI